MRRSRPTALELADPRRKSRFTSAAIWYRAGSSYGLKEFSICRTSDQCRFAIKANRPADLIHIELTGDRTMDYTTHEVGVGGIFQVDLDSPKGTPYSIKADYLYREKCENHHARV